MVDTVPPWLESMRADLGVEEIPGPEVNPRIIAKARLPGVKFPNVSGLVAYGLLYKSDDTQAWCGAEAGGCLAEVGIMPPFGPKDTDRYFWAASFRPWGVNCSIRVGAIVCFDGHVTMVNRIISASQIEVIGGNQGSPKGGAVTKSTRNTADVRACRWPDDASLIAAGLSQFSLSAAAPDPTAAPFRPEIKIGSTGGFVTEAQTLLGLAATGIFDQATKDAVLAFQASRGLSMVDGEIGAETWPVLLASKGQPIAPIAAGVLSPEAIARIVSIAGSSALASVNWKDRGVAPRGYIKGMAVAYAKVYADLNAGKSSAIAMTAPIGSADKDALAWYGESPVGRIATLRRLFALLIGLGMRESSGKYYEGRDASASNTSSDTAEAGLFQQSFNSFAASKELPKIFDAYTSGGSDGFLSIFREGLSGSPGPGSGDGAQGLAFQSLCKSKPAFAVECAAVGLRVVGGGPAPHGHWGPIRNRAAEIRPEADALLQQVQQVVDAVVTKPITEPIIIPPPITIEPEPPPAPPATNPLLLIILMLMMLALKEKPVVDDPAKPAQPDLLAALLPLILQALAGKPIALPAPEPPPPPPPPPPAATDPNAVLLALLTQLLAGKLPGVTAPVDPAAPKKSTEPVVVTPPKAFLEKPGTLIGLLISAGITALMGGGLIGTPLGMGVSPTTGGTLGLIAAAFAPLIGATGPVGKLLAKLGSVKFG